MEKEEILSPEEQKAEQEALVDAKEDEIRSSIISGTGLSEDANKEAIDKLVQRELAHRKSLSAAIRQKIDWRTKAQKPPEQKPPEKKQETAFDPEAIRKQTADTVTETLEKRDLDEMEYSEEIKAEIKKIAKLQGISVRKATQDPYIKHLIEQANADNRNLEAGTHPAPKSKEGSSGKIPKFDMSTPEGRKEYDTWKANRQNQ